MIAYLSGKVHEIRETSAVIIAGGIGYEVFCPTQTLARLSVGKIVELSTRFIVREDAQLLFGFSDNDSVKLFDLLISVSGVGAKMALSLLSQLSAPHLAQALSSGDVKLLSSVSGIGKKTAERLILELNSKIPEHLIGGAPMKVSTPKQSDAMNDATEALLSLGYRDIQVRNALSEIIQSEPDASADILIRKALGKLR